MHTEDLHSVVELLAQPIPDFVNLSYRLLLGRNPDPLELMERAGAIRGGLGRTRFLGDMSMSPEFKRHHACRQHDAGDEAFVEDLFLRFLGRRPDPGALEHYLGLLASGRDRRRVLRDISRSHEARIKRTFWHELEALLTDERAERHWFKRWISRSRRRERRCNRMQEANSLRSVTLWPRATNRTSAPQLEVPVSTNLFGDTGHMGRKALQVLSRIRQSAGSF